MRLTWGLCCQALCVMKSWLFRLLCQLPQLTVQELPLRVPTSVARVAQLQVPLALLQQADHRGTICPPTQCHSRIFSFKEVFVHNEVLIYWTTPGLLDMSLLVVSIGVIMLFNFGAISKVCFFGRPGQANGFGGPGEEHCTQKTPAGKQISPPEMEGRVNCRGKMSDD